MAGFSAQRAAGLIGTQRAESPEAETFCVMFVADYVTGFSVVFVGGLADRACR